jgi:hypothetical protein
MPFADYKDFTDCVSKNKSKDDPSAYCGYIKHQVEGGKKKEEIMDFPEHQLFHLEEAERSLNTGPSGKKLPYPCQYCTQQYPSYYALSEHMGIDHPDKFQHQEESHGGDRQTRLPKGVQHTIKRMGGPESWNPEGIEKETENIKEATAFLNTLKATIDEVTLIAKDTGYMGVSNKVSPTAPTYSFPVSGDLVDTVVHEVKGFDVQTNFYNQTMAELKDIVKDADKFFIDAGWNSKETVKEYAKHIKKNGKDFD